MNVFVLIAEHFEVPGRAVRVHATRAAADAEAVDMVNLMLEDHGWQPLATPVQWHHHLARLRADGRDCHVEVMELPVNGA